MPTREEIRAALMERYQDEDGARAAEEQAQAASNLQAMKEARRNDAVSQGLAGVATSMLGGSSTMGNEYEDARKSEIAAALEGKRAAQEREAKLGALREKFGISDMDQMDKIDRKQKQYELDEAGRRGTRRHALKLNDIKHGQAKELETIKRSSTDDNKNDELYVPGVGTALTKDDAKKLKNAKISKDKFDRQISEMIALRESKGFEVLDREAVKRGKQLSKDLLLTYKNLAKLGVLSKSDEEIVNAIIPADPLSSEPSNLVGQEPTLHVLKKFKNDLDNDFNSTIGVRLKSRDVDNTEQSRDAAPTTVIREINGKRYRFDPVTKKNLGEVK